MTFVEAGLYGMLGGILPEILALYNLRHLKKGEKPQWVGSLFYWTITLIMVLVGGGTVIFYRHIGINVNELMAIHLGISTPVLITTMTKDKLKID